MTINKKAFDSGIRVKPTSDTSTRQGDISISDLGVSPFRGTYDSADIYTTGDHVAFNERVYICTTLNVSGSPPTGDGTNNADWDFVKIADDIMKIYLGSQEQEIITKERPASLENKTIDATAATGNNTISADSSDIVYDDANEAVSSLGTDVQSALDSIKVALDNQNEASEIDYDNSTSGLAATDVQAAIDEVEARVDADETALSDHLADTVDAHDASAISVTPVGNLTDTEVQSALESLQTEVDGTASDADLQNHINETTGAHAASAISFTPTGDIAASDMQAAIEELDTEKASDADLTAHTSATSGVHGVTGNVVGDSDSQTLTNKTIDGADIQSPSRLDVKKDTEANLVTYASTASDGQLAFATDTLKMYQIIGNSLEEIGSGFDAIDTKANLDALTRAQGKEYYASDEDKIYTDDGTQLNAIATEDFVNSLISAQAGSPAASVKSSANAEILNDVRNTVGLIDVETDNTSSLADPAIVLAADIVSYTNSSGDDEIISGIELNLTAGTINSGTYVKATLKNGVTEIEDIIIDINNQTENLVLVDYILPDTETVDLEITEIVGDVTGLTIEGNIKATVEGAGLGSGVKKDTKANLDALTRVAGDLLYANDENIYYKDNGTDLIAVFDDETVSGKLVPTLTGNSNQYLAGDGSFRDLPASGGSGGGSGMLAGRVNAAGDPVSGWEPETQVPTRNVFINGDASNGTSGWTDASIGGGTFTNVSDQFQLFSPSNSSDGAGTYQAVAALDAGANYRLTFDLISATSLAVSAFAIRSGQGLSNPKLLDGPDMIIGTNTVDITGVTNVTFSVNGTGPATSNTVVIDNITVQELKTDCSTEEVTNGDFETGTIAPWVDVSIGAGTATVNGSNQLEIVTTSGSDRGRLEQLMSVPSSGLVELNYEIISGTSSLFLATGTSASGTIIFSDTSSTAGSYTEVIDLGGETSFYIYVSSSATTVYDNFSLKILQPCENSYGFQTEVSGSDVIINFPDEALNTAVSPIAQDEGSGTSYQLSNITSSSVTVVGALGDNFSFHFAPQNGEGVLGGTNVIMPTAPDTSLITELGSYTESGGVRYTHQRVTFDLHDFSNGDAIVDPLVEGWTSIRSIVNVGGDYATASGRSMFGTAADTVTIDSSGNLDIVKSATTVSGGEAWVEFTYEE